ncbi:MAG: hypothetical protein ACLR6I_11575 [Waltera sp.]
MEQRILQYRKQIDEWLQKWSRSADIVTDGEYQRKRTEAVGYTGN